MPKRLKPKRVFYPAAERTERSCCAYCGRIWLRHPEEVAQGRQYCRPSCQLAAETGAIRTREPAKPRPKRRADPSPPVIQEPRVAKALKAADSTGLSPRQMSKLRKDILACVQDQLTEAHKVVMGDALKATDEDGFAVSPTVWSPTQARVFGMLLNKVLPDLTASHTKVETTITKPVEQMSLTELEALVAGAKTIEGRASKTPIEDAEEIE